MEILDQRWISFVPLLVLDNLQTQHPYFQLPYRLEYLIHCVLCIMLMSNLTWASSTSSTWVAETTEAASLRSTIYKKNELA